MSLTSTIGVMALFLALGGCGLLDEKEEALVPPPSQPPPPSSPQPPTKVELLIDAAADINPDAAGRFSPVQLRVYEMKDANAFQSADFFGIYEMEQQALGPDILRKEEMMLRPGQQITIMLEPQADMHFLGAFAAFRDLAAAQWRGAVPITAHETTLVEIRINGTRLSVTATKRPATANDGEQ
jgi:type VI secretion system protein VasD